MNETAGRRELEGLVARVADEFIERQQKGERPDPAEYVTRHPEAASTLGRVLGMLQFVGPVIPDPETDSYQPRQDGPAVEGTLGDFRIVREVGRGGMGVVYEAEQLSLRRRVALKVLPFAATLDPRRLKRFHNEAVAAASLHHENIVPVFAVGCERGVHFYAMQLIDGCSVEKILNAKKAENEPGDVDGTPTLERERGASYHREVARLGVVTAEALEYAHSMGVVHRDVKPANLLLDGRGNLWVADFGLARLAAEPGVTTTGDVLGTLRYAAPEQAMAQHDLVDHRADVYSLGLTLYELLTLRPAVSGRDRQEVLRKIAFEEPVSPRKLEPALPVDLETVVLKAMAKNPRERYATAKELADDLRCWLDDRPVRARRPGPVQRLRRLARRHRAVFAALTIGLTLALAALAGCVGWVLRDSEARRAAAAFSVKAALGEAEDWLGKGRPYEALSVALRAEAITRQVGGHPDLSPRLDEMLWDVRLLLRLEQAALSDSGFTGARLSMKEIDEEYERAFTEFGLHPLAADNAEAAGRLQGRPVAVEVAAFLDHWSYVRRRARGVKDETWKPLLDVALRVDPDVARTRVRRGVLRLGWAKVADLVEPGDLDSLHGTSLKALVTHKGTPPRVMALLRLARQRRPDDYWVNRALGLALRTQDPPRWEEVIECYRAAVALRPRSAAAHVTLGSALKWKGRLEEAISCFRDATRHQPDSATAHYYLGFCLRKQGKYSEATACFQEAIRHHPGYAEAQRFLADGLMREGKVEEAIARYRELIRLRPDQIRAHRELGYALRKKGELDEAIRCFEAALRLRPDQAHAHVGLGLALGDIGRFAESLAAFRRAHQLGSKLPDWRYDSAKWVADAERLAELERKLPAVLEGKQCPADGTEAAGLAKVAAVKKLSVAAARLYQEAFVAAPTLASRPSKGHRYRAACQAALAGCGQGADSGGLDEKERSRLRKQALAWLRADLKSLNRLLDKQPDEPPPSVADKMRRWQADTAFAGVRGAEALSRLPEGERPGWRKLWPDVADTLVRATRDPSTQVESPAK